MIDTVILSIPQGKFQILNHDRFTPSSLGLFQYPYYKVGRFFKCVQNPTKKEMKNGFYRPRLTLTKAIRSGGYQIDLKIEYSVPKLFFGNNFEELQEENFLRSIRLLQRALYDMEVIVEFEDLENALVSGIHYSKNIHLTDHTTCHMVLDELRKVDLSARIDIGSEKFRGGGHALHYKTNHLDIVFYDKIKDLEQAKISEKKAIEKDNAIQLVLFDEIQNPNALQVFRMEVRLGNRQTIKKVFDKANVQYGSLTFSELFKLKKAKAVLGYFWNDVEKNSSLLNFRTENTFEFFHSLKANNPKISERKLLQLFGFIILGKEVGTKEMRKSLGYYGSKLKNNKWYALKKEIRELKYDKAGNWQAINSITEDIVKFEPVKTRNFIKIT